MNTTSAYLDPGSAGAIVQMIGGGLAALAVTVKLYGRRILRLVTRGGTHDDVDTASRQDAP